MSETPRESVSAATDKAWVEHWRKVGPQLERISREELRNYKNEENLELIDALLEIGARMGEPRTSSGLVEMQRLFQLAREKSQQ